MQARGLHALLRHEALHRHRRSVPPDRHRRSCAASRPAPAILESIASAPPAAIYSSVSQALRRFYGVNSSLGRGLGTGTLIALEAEPWSRRLHPDAAWCGERARTVSSRL